MKRTGLFLIALALVMSACNSNRVKVQGKVLGLKGTVKLLAELPNQDGMVVVAQQDVTDGKIYMTTDSLQLPARVWIDIAGKNTLETIIDAPDQSWVQGKAKFPDQIEVKGSGLDTEYAKLKKAFKEKYEGPMEPIDKKIQKVMDKPKRTTEDEIALGVLQMRRMHYIKARANYVKTLIEANPNQELSLFLLQDELRDSTDLQKRLFRKMAIPNKESNIYKNLAKQLQ